MKELYKYTIIKTKLVLDTDGDWFIDYDALKDFKDLILSVGNDSGFFHSCI